MTLDCQQATACERRGHAVTELTIHTADEQLIALHGGTMVGITRHASRWLQRLSASAFF